jgi:anaerobic selenocysteine-containing dehydrogenase
LSAPNGRRLDRALATLDHVVAIDPYLNETTRHAHVILPPSSPLTRAHYDMALYAFAVRNVAKYSGPVTPRKPSERDDWEILIELSARLFGPKALRDVTAAALSILRPERLLDVLLRVGPHKLSLAKLRRRPHGVDLGPLLPGQLRIYTRDGRIDLAPGDFVANARTCLGAEPERDESEDLVLIGRRDLRSNNSWMHNSARLVKGPARCTLFIHPRDASRRALVSGNEALLGSPAGTIVVRVEVTDTVAPGVVSLPHGWGHDREGTRLAVARQHAGVSVNDITSEHHLDTLSGNAAFNGLPVTLDPR